MNESLVGEIDGENVAFAIASQSAAARIDGIRRFKTSEFPTFTDALQHYTRMNGLTIDRLNLCLAVAGVSRGDVITMSNCRWFISVSGLKAFLRTEPLIINDFAATAWSLAGAEPSLLKRIGPNLPQVVKPGGTYLIVGAGSGLGMATLSMRADGSIVILESEGGHSSFAPQSTKEDEILVSLRRKFGHVSYERFLSLPGLQNIYAALSPAGDHTAPPRPEAIISGALARTDQVAIKAGELFSGVLGSFIGNGVMNSGAWDGVFLVGSMIETMIPLLERGPFRAQLTAKGRMGKPLEKVPTSLFKTDSASLLGAAAALSARTLN